MNSFKKEKRENNLLSGTQEYKTHFDLYGARRILSFFVFYSIEYI